MHEVLALILSTVRKIKEKKVSLNKVSLTLWELTKLPYFSNVILWKHKPFSLHNDTEVHDHNKYLQIT